MGHNGSNDTAHKTVALPGVEPIAVQTDKQTDIFGYYYIDYIIISNQIH